MELRTLGELIRAEETATPASAAADELVDRALRRGRRAVIGRRVAAAVACCALLVTGAAVAFQLPGRPVETMPAAPTTSAATAPPSDRAAPTPSAATALPRDPAAPTVTDMLAFFRAQLPDTFRYSEISDDREPMAGEVHVMFTLTDAAGESQAGGGIMNEVKSPKCEASFQCRRERLAGGTLLASRSPKSQVAGEVYEYYSFQRRDGHWIWFSQQNSFPSRSKRKEITRPTVPLSWSEVRDLLTAPEWDPLVARCAAAGDAC